MPPVATRGIGSPTKSSSLTSLASDPVATSTPSSWDRTTRPGRRRSGITTTSWCFDPMGGKLLVAGSPWCPSSRWSPASQRVRAHRDLHLVDGRARWRRVAEARQAERQALRAPEVGTGPRERIGPSEVAERAPHGDPPQHPESRFYGRVRARDQVAVTAEAPVLELHNEVVPSDIAVRDRATPGRKIGRTAE